MQHPSFSPTAFPSSQALHWSGKEFLLHPSSLLTPLCLLLRRSAQFSVSLSLSVSHAAISQHVVSYYSETNMESVRNKQHTENHVVFIRDVESLSFVGHEETIQGKKRRRKT
jgi:hypothetical protein